MFGITPKAFDAIKMIPSFGSAKIFSDHYTVTSNSQRSINMPVIGVVQTSLPGVFPDKSNKFSNGSFLNRKRLDQSVPLQNPENNNFVCSSPAAFYFSGANKGRFGAFNGSFKGHPSMFFIGTAGSDQSKETFNCRGRINTPVPQPVDRNSQGKKLNKFSFCSVRKLTAFPNRFNFKTRTTPTTFHSAIGKFPGSRILTLCTSFHN